MRVFTLFFPKCDCLCCLERVYSLAEVEQYVPPVHQSAVIELVNSLWSLNNQDNENSGVRTAHWHYCLTLYAFWLVFFKLLETWGQFDKSNLSVIYLWLTILVSSFTCYTHKSLSIDFIPGYPSRSVFRPVSLFSTICWWRKNLLPLSLDCWIEHLRTNSFYKMVQ